MPPRGSSGNMNCAQIHVSPDAGVPTYMYEFQYRPSFISDTRPKTVMGDHGDEIFSVFGAPFLKGNGFISGVTLVSGGLGSSLGLGTFNNFSFSPVLISWPSTAPLTCIRQFPTFLLF